MAEQHEATFAAMVDGTVVLDAEDTGAANTSPDWPERKRLSGTGTTSSAATYQRNTTCWRTLSNWTKPTSATGACSWASRGSRKLAYDLIYQASPGRLQANSFLFQKVQPGAQLWTDGASIYQKSEEYWPVTHTVDIHKKFEFTHTSEIEGTFGNLRTFIHRMYHHTTPEKFPDYVREFCFRFSTPELFESPQLYCEKTLMLVPRG